MTGGSSCKTESPNAVIVPLRAPTLSRGQGPFCLLSTAEMAVRAMLCVTDQQSRSHMHIVQTPPEQIADALMAGEPVRPELRALYARVLRGHLAELEATLPPSNVVRFPSGGGD